MFAAQPKNFNYKLFLYTRTNLLIGIGAILLGLLMIWQAILPQISSITATQAKLAKEKKALKQITLKLQELDAVKISPEFNKTDNVNQVLPSKKPLLEFMAGLNSIATATRVSVSDLKVSPGQLATNSSQLKNLAKKTAGSRGYESLDITLSVAGEMNQVQRFLSLIEQISPISTITKIELNRDNKTTTGEVINTKANLQLRIHYFTQQISSSLSTPLPQISAREREIFRTIQEFTLPETPVQNQIIGGGNQNLFGLDAATLAE